MFDLGLFLEVFLIGLLIEYVYVMCGLCGFLKFCRG